MLKCLGLESSVRPEVKVEVRVVKIIIGIGVNRIISDIRKIMMQVGRTRGITVEVER